MLNHCSFCCDVYPKIFYSCLLFFFDSALVHSGGLQDIKIITTIQDIKFTSYTHSELNIITMSCPLQNETVCYSSFICYLSKINKHVSLNIQQNKLYGTSTTTWSVIWIVDLKIFL